MYIHSNRLKEGYVWVTLENVAFIKRPSDARSVILFVSKEEIINIFTYDQIGMYAALLQRIPKSIKIYAKWNNDEVWHHSSFCSNLYHQLDHIMFFDIANKKEFQPIDEVIFDSYNGQYDVYEMHNFIQKIISTKLSKTKFYYSNYMYKLYRKYGIIFFRKVHVAIKSGYYDFYFYNPRITKEFRDVGFRLINYNINDYLNNDDNNNDNKKHQQKSINICILIRKNQKSTRNILNANQIYEMLKNIKKHIINRNSNRNKNRDVNINVEMIYFDGFKSSDQIKIIMNRDIIIAPHGAGLTNLIWVMKKGVVVIECYSVFRIIAFSKISTTLGFHYISLGSTRIYEDMSEFYDFNNKNNIGHYYGDFPQVHSTVFSYHPLRLAVKSKMSVSVRQILSSVYYAIRYNLYVNN